MLKYTPIHVTLHFCWTSFESLNYMAFQSLDFERTWLKLFQKRVMRTKFDIYVFISWCL